MKSSWLSIVCAAALAAALLPVQAQVQPPTAGTVQETLPRPERARIDPATPAVEQPAPRRERAPGDGPTVSVQRFVLSGNTVIGDAELQEALAPWLNRPLTLEQIYQAADALTALYRARGYGLAQATVPAQRIEGGTVRLEILEGRVGQVSLADNRTYDYELLSGFSRSLQPGEVYQTADMERAILLINDLPGLDARAVIKPGASYGTVDVVIRVEESPYAWRLSLDNHGREELGEGRVLAEADFNNPFGIGDQFTAGVLYSEDGLLKYGSLAYGLPLGSSGGRLRVTVNQADYEVGGEVFAALGVAGDNTNYRVDYSLPFLRSRTQNLIFTAGLSRNEAETLIAGSPTPLNETELNLLEAGLFWNRVFDDGGSLALSGLFTGNFKGNELGDQPDAQKGKLRLDATWSLPFGRWSLITRGIGVYSPDPLADTQKFSLGGPYSVRGYVPAEARGDKGAFLSTELQRHFRVWNARMSLGLFVDAGTVKRYPTPAGLADREDSLAAAGLSLNLASNSWYSASLSVAAPIGNHVNPLDPALEYDNQIWALFSASF